MQMKRLAIIILPALLIALLQACKPSEKNYKAAYELAVQRDHEGLEDSIYNLIKQEELPRIARFGADSAYVAPRESLLIFWQPGSTNTSLTTAPAYNLVIGEYTNPTNARAHAMQFMPPTDPKAKKAKPKKGEKVAADTIPDGWDWYPMVLLRGADDHYYVAIAHSDSIEGLLPTQQKFRDKGLRVVGAPVPIVRTRR